MTSGVSVAVVGAPEIAKELGKKGTSSDLTLYNTTREGHAVTLVEPTQFPEKFGSLLATLGMADRCLLVIPELSRAVAEVIATLEVVDVPTTVVLGPTVGESEVQRALKGGRLESAVRVSLDFPRLRAMIDAWTAPAVDGPVLVPLDHAFPVKGVGAVALGVVRRGTLRVHEKLRLWPTPKLIEVRSLQVHDVDRKDAGCGERVGAAIKGAEADELSRGQVLAPEGSLAEGTTLSGGPIVRCRYYRGDAATGARIHAAIGLQFVPASLDESTPNGVTMTTDRAVVYEPGVLATLADLSVPAGPRIIGRTMLH